MTRTTWMRLLLLAVILTVQCSVLNVFAQITIGGNVYGGGNAGDTGGNTSVTVRAGEISAVYGGARMADVKGAAFVNIDGKKASADILITNVYGGNDISGTIGHATAVPAELENVKTDASSTDKTKNAIDNTWSAFVRTSPCETKRTVTTDEGTELTADERMLVVGSLYGGGNGDYTYKDANGNDLQENGKYIVRDAEGDIVATSTTAFNKPELAKTYLELKGGCIAHVYGGGNNATVTENTTINIDNTSDDLEKAVIVWAKANDKPLAEVFQYLINKVKLSTFQSALSSFAFNYSRIFGGNNKADMAIRPVWNLQKGIIRDLYSGGNQGAMTYEKGILLSIDPVNSDDLKINNVYGGCRMADVNPAKAAIPAETINGTYYPAGYAARVLVEGGDIQNVYGGNDISGTIYGGNAVGIHSSIKGDVYGGGNGSYAYTDNAALKDDPNYSDFYYPVPEGMPSVEALRAFRPNAESVSIRLVGKYEKDSDGKVIEGSIVPTIIGGAVYCGGNSATLHNSDPTKEAAAELKIGSYVMADKVFLGNNGANMAAENMLKQYSATVEDSEGHQQAYSQMTLASEAKDGDGRTQFDKYMDGVVMDIMPRVVFDDVGTYVPYSTYFGSFYCGGNVGSMKVDGAIDISFTDKVVVFDKVVGGSNEANVYETDYNPQYLGGLLGRPEANGNKLILNFDGLKIQPMRWKAQIDNSEGVVYPNQYLEWNTVKYDAATKTYTEVAPVTSGSGTSNAADLERRLKGGNIYGGCYSNGHVEGNVVINLDATIHEREKLFDVTTNEGDKNYENVEKAEKDPTFYNISERKTGVIRSQQGTDCFVSALNVFGGGYGGDSEIWGSATINLNSGYTFQIFGGGEQGAIGNAVSSTPDPNNTSAHILTYEYNKDYSTYVNLSGDKRYPGVARGAEGDSDDMAECEYLYGGAFEGVVAGDSYVNLGNGRIFNSFAGSCNADILGYTATYIGRQPKGDGTYMEGFPYVRDYVYGGNDLGGIISGSGDFSDRIRTEQDKGMIYDAGKDQMKHITTYVEYTQGRVEYMLGGGSGNYDYTSGLYEVGSTCRVKSKPYQHNTFVNFRPNSHPNNYVEKIFGAGEGYPGDREGDQLQAHSYVLIDIPDGVDNFANTEAFGAGANNGLGMKEFLAPQAKPAEGATKEEREAYDAYETSLDEASAIIDLMHGRFGAVYGGSYEQGVTRRTVVNVPKGSTIKIGSIFGGAYGSDTFEPCDVYEANVNYSSEDAYLIYDPLRTDEKTKEKLGNKLLKGAIYGGNNAERRTLYGRININAPVRQKHYLYGWSNATVYGAGCGSHTWNEYTEVNLNEGAKVWEVYGGGEAGGVLNAESAQAYIASNPYHVEPDAKWVASWTLGSGYDNGTFGHTDYKDNTYADNPYTNLNNPLVRVAEIDDRADIASTDTKHYKRYNTNVIIHKGAYVGNYAYGGGYGYEGDAYYGSGDVYGTTYIALLGGIVNKDIYAAGTSGAVYNIFGANFTASSNAFIGGGSARNVYGGGWKGSVGHHTGDLSSSTEGDVPGETHVVIGKIDGTSFTDGIPAIQRNAYGGGEGGSIIGQANLTLNNGYIGYIYSEANGYEEKVNDETWTDHVGKDRLSDCGNIFGGGYDDNSCVDESRVVMWGGVVRNTIFGGGEIATIGRGSTKESGEDNKNRTIEAIYKAGKTHIEMYNGHVKRNVFGGGKGYNILGYGGIHGFYTDGYVFGGTEVYIHGGEIGTEEGVALKEDGTGGYGNVFGGGDVGFVYSGSYFTGSHNQGTGSPNHYYYYDKDGMLTEDCKVVIAPMLQVKKNGTPVTFGGKTYYAYDYVPTDYLNTLPADKTADAWKNLYTGDKLPDGTVNPDDPEERGIYIHNAVFAGGNVSSNSESYTNATTVFGNTTATLYDVYHHDFITVGTEHTGGLYGGGNLSIVGGYRELNITNYGTDYYGLDQQISLEEYRKLTNRERAYFKLEYLCQQDVTINGKVYNKDERIDEDEYNALPEAYKNETYWVQYGFCSIYAGRLLNTIQRADFCGVFGSRLVLQGAKDRVAEVGDATEYTINRVSELSLNQKRSEVPGELDLKPGAAADSEDYADEKNAIHGNYFGIYSVVNYLGSLTSDVHFTDNRRYVEKGLTHGSGTSYYDWKTSHLDKRDRNNGTAFNQVALASGVFLELTSENSTPSNKIYGDITGVVELDLINVKKDIEGGGYVYARNEHGRRSEVSHVNTLLSEYNRKAGDEALTKKIYTYSSTDLLNHQTSGNFIHKSKRIVDDCYPNNGIYNDGYVKSPAHYWYIKGEVYIYDQVVSAYAGSASAYSKEVKIPLTITAGSNGRLKLLNVQPNRYAYYADESRSESKKVTEDGVKVDNESMTYHLNDVITWWDWHQLSQNEQKYFVKETYVNVEPCIVDGKVYAEGTYVLENDPTVHATGETTAYQKFLKGGHTVLDSKGEPVTDLTKLFHSSNNIGHDTGYVLTLDMNSPKDWDDWYSPVLGSSDNRIRKDAYEALSDADKAKYREGPTYTLSGASGLYGQREYSVGEIITKEVYDDYTSTVGKMHQQPEDQATAEPAYVALADYGNTQAGNAIGKDAYDKLGAAQSNFAPAMVCINSIQLGEEDYVLLGELVSGTDASLEALAKKYKEYNNAKINADQIDDAAALEYVKSHLSPAYYINSEGLYGGQYYEAGENYSAIKSWCTLSDDRNKFNFNYDAFDVLVDPEYHGEGYTETYYHSPYSDEKSVEYEAAYLEAGSLTYYDINNEAHTISSGNTITREEYENVRNDQLHYTRIQVDQGSDVQTVYIVNETMIDNGTPYAKGQDISEKDFKALSAANQKKVDVVTFQKGTAPVVKYYCYEDYTPAKSFTTERGSAGEKGSVISALIFNDDVPNYQKYFSILGAEPTETTTLYVSRESNAKDVTSEKVISVVYQYTYYEADDEGEGVSLVNELHVLNIHLQLESGAPEIGPLNTPPTVLPGNTIGLKAPTVNPGLYEVLTNGWELFNSEDDAMLHRNGVPFINNGTPLYWYQNQKVFLAFYSKTYLGKTYSNYVPLSVANYHDLDAIMKDKEHHLYVDHPDVMRNSKIYIDNRDCESDPEKSELDLLKDFFDLSLQTTEASAGATAGHALLDSHVKGGADLEFFLNSDISPKKYTDWTPVGNESQCFMGELHGDGYTVSGLNNSMFGQLCGNVYNLGVTGSFSSAGVADSGSGYVENCWINTTGTPTPGVKAVFNGGDDGSQKDGDHVLLANCYYPDTKAYTPGLATPMTEREFYNGTVAYNLNGYYLNKRYYDNNTSWTGNKVKYNYFKLSADGNISEAMSEGQYPDTYAFYPLEEGAAKLRGYVEERYYDGDFIYAGGTVPEAYDERMRVAVDGEKTVVVYAPIWPDDYIYFGQSLTYGYNGTHQGEPSSVSKNGGRITADGNRVFRAPAYFGNSTMSVAHFNSTAVIPAQSKTSTETMVDAYPGMTAIDFAGHNDNSYLQGLNGKLFYQPLLDDEGLTSINTNGQTPNLLVYAPVKTANQMTFNVLNSYFAEPAFSNFYYDNDPYRRVDLASTSAIVGHLVQGNLKATSDHLLVDKKNFNCPIAFEYDGSHRMWYQRTPDNYVGQKTVGEEIVFDTQAGWEAVSLPFSAELVSTPDKGEITHFYKESATGHEYWLREFKGGKISASDDKVFVGDFEKPEAGLAGSKSKEYTNTFLWDYYYSKDSSWDNNEDTYHKTYYSEPHTYNAYAYAAAGTPYLIGFPGSRYYEFDLSGKWTPENRYQNVSITNPGRQIITFASAEDATIAVSDKELAQAKANGYAFVPVYQSMTLDAGNGYLLNGTGSSFDKNAQAATTVPFRPYFVQTANGTRGVDQIVFGEDDSSFDAKDHGDPSKGVGTLNIWAKKDKIFVESSLSFTEDLRVVTPAGITVATFAVKPGQTVEVKADFSGVYVVHTLDGLYTKSVIVKK